jgi:hypothetical protein
MSGSVNADINIINTAFLSILILQESLLFIYDKGEADYLFLSGLPLSS